MREAELRHYVKPDLPDGEAASRMAVRNRSDIVQSIFIRAMDHGCSDVAVFRACCMWDTFVARAGLRGTPPVLTAAVCMFIAAKYESQADGLMAADIMTLLREAGDKLWPRCRRWLIGGSRSMHRTHRMHQMHRREARCVIDHEREVLDVLDYAIRIPTPLCFAAAFPLPPERHPTPRSDKENRRIARRARALMWCWLWDSDPGRRAALPSRVWEDALREAVDEMDGMDARRRA